MLKQRTERLAGRLLAKLQTLRPARRKTESRKVEQRERELTARRETDFASFPWNPGVSNRVDPWPKERSNPCSVLSR
jgi:hypothetical protein